MKLKEFLQVCSGDEIQNMKELKEYSDVNKSFTGDFNTEIEVEVEDGLLTVCEKNEDNCLIIKKPVENWLNEESAKNLIK